MCTELQMSQFQFSTQFQFRYNIMSDNLKTLQGQFSVVWVFSVTDMYNYIWQ